jgi:hypothetical protein
VLFILLCGYLGFSDLSLHSFSYFRLLSLFIFGKELYLFAVCNYTFSKWWERMLVQLFTFSQAV